jgi:hypothetical protein
MGGTAITASAGRTSIEKSALEPCRPAGPWRPGRLRPRRCGRAPGAHAAGLQGGGAGFGPWRLGGAGQRRLARFRDGVHRRGRGRQADHAAGRDAWQGRDLRQVEPAHRRPAPGRLGPDLQGRLQPFVRSHRVSPGQRDAGLRLPRHRDGDRRVQQARPRGRGLLDRPLRPEQPLRSQSSAGQAEQRRDPGGGAELGPEPAEPSPHRPQLFRPAAPAGVQWRRDDPGRDQRILAHPAP